MLDKLRRALRACLVNVVEDAMARHYARHHDELAALRHEVAMLRADLQQESSRMLELDRQVEIRGRRDVFAEWEREAVAESAEFVKQHMSDARPLDDPRATLEYALRLAPSGGLALEFGVYTGASLSLIAAARGDGHVYGFDDTTFDDTAQPPDVPGAAVVEGQFDESLPRFLAEHPETVDFVHIDSDLYSSTATVLEHVGPRLREGSVLVFDEYFNYPGWTEHECLAWSEYVARSGTAFRYEAYTLDNEQVVVRITSG